MLLQFTGSIYYATPKFAASFLAICINTSLIQKLETEANTLALPTKEQVSSSLGIFLHFVSLSSALSLLIQQTFNTEI